MPVYHAFHVPEADAARVHADLREYVAGCPSMTLRKRLPKKGNRTFVVQLADNFARTYALCFTPPHLERLRTTGTDWDGNPLT